MRPCAVTTRSSSFRVSSTPARKPPASALVRGQAALEIVDDRQQIRRAVSRWRTCAPARDRAAGACADSRSRRARAGPVRAFRRAWFRIRPAGGQRVDRPPARVVVVDWRFVRLVSRRIGVFHFASTNRIRLVPCRPGQIPDDKVVGPSSRSGLSASNGLLATRYAGRYRPRIIPMGASAARFKAPEINLGRGLHHRNHPLVGHPRRSDHAEHAEHPIADAIGRRDQRIAVRARRNPDSSPMNRRTPSAREQRSSSCSRSRLRWNASNRSRRRSTSDEFVHAHQVGLSRDQHVVVGRRLERLLGDLDGGRQQAVETGAFLAAFRAAAACGFRRGACPRKFALR